ncbi:ATP-binding protein [Amycolatopsis anabasis]|uniref:ATP-binding protein n=1 Tax=Amycolatopsis anabasis TaxID=1840409 RepID=UPI00131CF1D3|nr:ATP-binding protein [Amycolatopsis anabasis]
MWLEEETPSVRLAAMGIPGREHALIQLDGVLDVTTYPRIRDFLLKCAVQGPQALIVDVGGLRMPCRRSILVFAAVWIRIENWPGIPLALVAEHPDTRETLRSCLVHEYVPTYPDVATALRSLKRPPAHRRVSCTLPWFPESSVRARRFVEVTCAGWRIPDTIVQNAVVIASELVENTLKHTCSEAELRLELRRGLLTVAVSDLDPAEALLIERTNRTPSGYGLLLVSHLAKAWGCTPTAIGGKVVWAVLVVG